MESVLRRKPQDTSREHIHLSPRMWGTWSPCILAYPAVRFIPTNVGNIRTCWLPILSWTVHPHGCGEHSLTGSSISLPSGSSPRMGGNISRCGRRLGTSAVHPHECGEHSGSDPLTYRWDGSSPRMWGTCHPGRESGKSRRFIPTNVGNMNSGRRRSKIGSVHPHECGEHIASAVIIAIIAGSSPRMWGTLNRRLRILL